MIKLDKLKVVCDAACRVKDAHVKGRESWGESACGIILLEGNKIISEKGSYLGKLTVPEAEYNGLIRALELALDYLNDDTRENDLEVWMDSELAIRQLNKEYRVKAANIKPLYETVRSLESQFKKITYFHHGRESELAKHADRLANEALNEVLKKRS